MKTYLIRHGGSDNMKKRDFLKIVGGGVILAATPGCAFIQPEPSRALAPWSAAGVGYAEPRKHALSYAILCPNPHNRQPWQVDLSVENEVRLYVDPERLLPHTDPYSRQITIGLGCFLELMSMAAAAQGWAVSITSFPEGSDTGSLLDGRTVALARFTRDPSIKADPLFDHVMARRSVKDPYDTKRPVPNDALQAITLVSLYGNQIDASNDAKKVSMLRTLTHEALQLEIDTPHTYKESVDLFRIGKKEVEANPDGIDFSGRTFEVLGQLGLMSRESALDTTTKAYRQGVDAVLSAPDTAMAHLWVVSLTNERKDQINAGRDWMRIHLATTQAGLSMQPLSQALQEYPEMENHYRRAHDLLAPNGGTVQMLARLGYGAPTPRSPRWSLESILERRA